MIDEMWHIFGAQTLPADLTVPCVRMLICCFPRVVSDHGLTTSCELFLM